MPSLSTERRGERHPWDVQAALLCQKKEGLDRQTLLFWHRGGREVRQEDSGGTRGHLWTHVCWPSLSVSVCSPADMASSPCRLCLRPTGGCGWRRWMEKNLYDYIHLLSVSPSTHKPNVLQMGPDSFSYSADLHAAIFAQQKRGE